MGATSSFTRSTSTRIKRYFISGALFVIPAVVTLAILVFVFGFIADFLRPVAGVIVRTTGIGRPTATVVVLLSAAVVVLCIGIVIETVPHGTAAATFVHGRVEALPGVGPVYAGFREMSETVANGEDSFRDVKLVEYPNDGSYTMAFVTADAPAYLEESAGHGEEGMISLFLPMGPNPIMGGFVIYVARDRVHDIDIGVEEGLQAVITSGVTVGDPEGAAVGERIHRRLENE